MKETALKIENEEKFVVNNIDETPFKYVETKRGKYITCGRVVLETGMTKEETSKWIKEKPWEVISLLCQGLINEINNDKKQ